MGWFAPSRNPVQHLFADCEPGLITHHQCPTSLMLLWLKGSKSLQPGPKMMWKVFPKSWGCDTALNNIHWFSNMCIHHVVYKSNTNISHDPTTPSKTHSRSLPVTYSESVILTVQSNSSLLYRLTVWFIAFCCLQFEPRSWLQRKKETLNYYLLWLYSTSTMALSSRDGSPVLLSTVLSIFYVDCLS